MDCTTLHLPEMLLYLQPPDIRQTYSYRLTEDHSTPSQTNIKTTHTNTGGSRLKQYLSATRWSPEKSFDQQITKSKVETTKSQQ